MCCMSKRDLTSKGGQISSSICALDVAIEFFFRLYSLLANASCYQSIYSGPCQLFSVG